MRALGARAGSVDTRAGRRRARARARGDRWAQIRQIGLEFAWQMALHFNVL